MNQIFNFQNQSVRIQFQNNEPYFCLADVAKIMEIKNPRQLKLNSKGVCKAYTPTESGNQEMTFINEPNLYRVIFRSNKPEAVKFQDWIFEEVIPKIRQTGTYSASPKPIPNKTTTKDREPLRNAVNLLVSKKGLNFSEAYKLVHQRFNVAHLDELSNEQIPQAVEYVHRVLCGEVLDKLDTPPQVQQAHIPEAALKHIAGIVRLTPRLMRYCKKHNDGLEHFTGRRDLEMYTSFLDCHAHAMELADMFHINRELWRYPAANW